MNRIALVEDHERIAALVRKALAGAGIEVDSFDRIEPAWHAVRQTPYAVLIVDRGLPDGDGLLLVQRLRAAGLATPCLMLTARDALHDRVEGLESGADDYLAKPFPMEELVARVRALLRRPAQLQSLAPAHGDLQLQPEGGRMQCGTESVSLPPAELQIMLCLVKAAGGTVRRAALETAAWGLAAAVTPNAMDVAMHRLRKKLLAIGSSLQIVNMRGHGYALREASLAP
jgi:DNA-binding response OmpR family regulator